MGRHNARGFTLTDLMICLVILGMTAAVLLPAAGRSRETANRVKCASNLRQIGQAMLLYANENRQAWPRTIHDPASPTTTAFTGVNAANPFLPDGPAPNDVTAAFYLLIRTQDLGSEAFICPSSGASRMLLSGGAAAYSNFPGLQNLSYSLADPYPDEQAMAAGYDWQSNVNPEFAVAADIASAVPALLTVTPATPQSRLRQVNSFNHDGDGQNVLFSDGHAEFCNTPLVGVKRDNIYTSVRDVVANSAPAAVAAGSAFTLSAPPAGPDDSVLLPLLPPGSVPPGRAEVHLNLTAIFLIGGTLFALIAAGIALLMRRNAAASGEGPGERPG